MSQPAVSGALARLRQQFDDPLLIRQGRGFELTTKAESILPSVNEAVQSLSQMLDLLPTFDPATSNRTFYISASDYVLSQLISPLFNLLSVEAPGVRVVGDSLPAGTAVTPEDLLRRDLVIAGTGRGVPGKRRALFSDKFVCIADRNNSRLNDGKLALTDLALLKHVRASFGEGNTTHVDDMLVRAEITPRVGLVVQGFLPVPVAVSGTEMIGHVPQMLAERYAESLGLVIAQSQLDAFLVEAAHWHPSKNADPAIQWLIEILYRTSALVEFGNEPLDN